MDGFCKFKILPIFIESSIWYKITSKLVSSLPDNFLQAMSHAAYSLKLQWVDIDVFRVVQRYLIKINSAFHTFPLHEVRILKVVIKSLPLDTSESEITNELTSKGYDVKFTLQFANSARKISDALGFFYL